MKKVVLINTCGSGHDTESNSHLPFKIPMGPHFPLGVSSIASYLKKNLPQTPLWVLDDQLLSSKKIEQELKQIRPDVVGIAHMFKNYNGVLKLARTAKEIGAKVVMGGNYATSLAREILINRGLGSSDYCIDAVVKQDGEKAFCQYVKSEPLRNINNLVYWHDGKVVENGVKLLRLDDLPSLRIDIISPEAYFKEYQKRFPDSQYKRPFIIYSQKGCFWRSKPSSGCIFCSLMYKEWRLRNPKSVWNEIDKLVFDYGVDYIWDVSDSLLSDKNWFREFYRESRRRPKRPFFKIQARADELIDEDIVKMLVDLNVAQVFVGFESGDDKCLVRMKKGMVSQVNKIAISLLAKYSLPIRAYFVLGAPGETKQSLAKTVNLAEKIISAGRENLLVPSFLTPLPDSPAFQLLKQKTGKKYTVADDINWSEAISDWVKYFCNVTTGEIKETLEYLRQAPYDINAYSY